MTFGTPRETRGACNQDNGLPWLSFPIPPTSIEGGGDDTWKANSIGKWIVWLELGEMVLLETSRAKELCS